MPASGVRPWQTGRGKDTRRGKSMQGDETGSDETGKNSATGQVSLEAGPELVLTALIVGGDHRMRNHALYL
jgi:hypothetical protein